MTDRDPSRDRDPAKDRDPTKDRDPEVEQHGPTVRDKRRIDPDTYQVREPQATAASAAEFPSAPEFQGARSVQDTTDSGTAQGELAEVKAALAERTGDLQRLQAEYINYKRRVDRDRNVSRTSTIEGVLKDFLPVLDDLRSAREHEELSGGFKAVADEVERVAAKYGLETFGQPGDPFDPHIHEALLHAHSAEIDGPTCVEILQPGYRIGEKILRPARVAVAEPGPDQVDAAPQAGEEVPATEALADSYATEALADSYATEALADSSAAEASADASASEEPAAESNDQ